MVVTKDNIDSLKIGCLLIDPEGTKWTIIRFCPPDIYCRVPYLDLVQECGIMIYKAYEYIYGWEIIQRK